MKPGTVLAVVLVALGCAPFANADPVLLVNGSGVLTGARNVRVGGTLYNVTFVDGTCIDVFGGAILDRISSSQRSRTQPQRRTRYSDRCSLMCQ